VHGERAYPHGVPLIDAARLAAGGVPPMTLPSRPPLTSVRPPGENASDHTSLAWPFKVRCILVWARFHTLIVPSSLALARVPSAEKASARTVPSCPRSGEKDRLVGQVPNADHPVRAAAGESAAVRREGERPDGGLVPWNVVSAFPDWGSHN